MSSDQNTTQETIAIKREPGASWKANEIHHLPENQLNVVSFFCLRSRYQYRSLRQVMAGLMLSVFLAALDQVIFSCLYKQNTVKILSIIDDRCFSFANYRRTTWRRAKLQLDWKVTKLLTWIFCWNYCHISTALTYLAPLGMFYLNSGAMNQ
jgi:hypothetical protein